MATMDLTNSMATSPVNLDLNINHFRPPNERTPRKDLGFNLFGTDRKLSEAGFLMEELSRMSAENKRLNEMLTTMCENYNTLQNHLMELTSKTTPSPEILKKRKSESEDNTETCSSDEDSSKKPKTSEHKSKIWKAYIRTEPSDTTLIFKDGYQWRKYGQKVTRDNPCPRAYFKCSFAPSCLVKKKVQRSVEDRSILVATYDGEHNHAHPSQAEATLGLPQGVTVKSIPCSASVGSSGPSITLDLTQPGLSQSHQGIEQSPAYKQYLVEQMASSLSKDPSFKAALAAAISGRMIQHPMAERL